MNAKDTVKGIFNRLGLDIRKMESGTSRPRTTMFEAYAHLKQMGVEPKTVIDVGVATGTEELYQHFAAATILLVEPLADFESHLKSILTRYKGSYVLGAAGSSKGEVTFNVHGHQLDGSSMLKETAGSHVDGKEITVPLFRIDDLVAEKELEGPFLIKVDVQGAELEVLKGATATVEKADAIALEVSLFEFMKGAAEICEVLSFMKESNFVPYDIVLGWNRPLDNALGQVDIVFVKEDGFLRKSHAYA